MTEPELRRRYLRKIKPTGGTTELYTSKGARLIDESAKKPRRPTNRKRKRARIALFKELPLAFIYDGVEYRFCPRCHHALPRRTFQVDHVKPILLGGESEIANLQLLCQPCNSSKGTDEADYRDRPAPPEAQPEIVRNRHPRRPFRW